MEAKQHMNDSKAIEEARGFIRLALPLMSQYQIPITPKNYAVWYKYISSADNELSRTIDSMRDKGEEFSDENNESLYWRFCAEKGENELRKFREDLKQILMDITKEVNEITGQAQEYHSLVSNSVNSLSDDASVKDIKNVITTIINETKMIAGFGKTMQH